jgi:ABC-type transport system involved in multi-copper enzyme maturation permease subunit
MIAGNFVREQRWPILVLLMWVLGLAVIGLFFDVRNNRDDILLIFKQLAIYGIAFSVFFGGSAIHNERKSRRILAVVSKSVGRQQYVAGLLLGVALASGLYCFAMGITASWVLGSAGFPVHRLIYLIICLFVASVLAASVSVMFSTFFFNPLLATGATGVFLSAPVLAMQVLGSQWGYLLPVYSLVELFLKTSFYDQRSPDWSLVAVASCEVVMFWVMASTIFALRDIAVAVE